MKTFGIVLGILIILFAIVQIFAYRSRKNIESYPFSVEKKYSNFEIRNYEASLFTAVKLETNNYDKASSKGFSILGGYIFGANEKNEKIAMTSPVAMALQDSITMLFMVPKNLKKENLPKPNTTQIAFKEVPAKKVAAITFGGWANTAKIEKYKQQLKEALDAERISYTNNFYFLGYNPPYDIFGRKNEVIVALVAVR